MADLIRVLPKREIHPESDPHLREEWLVTNGMGGYASGTVTGAITRRYHGLLIAALPNPLGRMMMLNGLSERLRLPDRRVMYTGAEELAGITPEHILPVAEFRLEGGLPVCLAHVTTNGASFGATAAFFSVAYTGRPFA